jgi:hypothetical protein
MTPSLSSAEVPTQRPYLDLFLISFLLLFFELACIRWFGSMVVYLTFFTNIVLLATFLGMSIGCLSASRGRDWVRSVMPLFLVAVILACGVLWIYSTYGRVMVDVGGKGRLSKCILAPTTGPAISRVSSCPWNCWQQFSLY